MQLMVQQKVNINNKNNNKSVERTAPKWQQLVNCKRQTCELVNCANGADCGAATLMKMNAFVMANASIKWL